jgi:hypothetical protein
MQAIWPALVLCALAVAGWIFTAGTGAEPGTAVFGLYRDRAFVANLLASWAAAIVAWLRLARPSTAARLRLVAVHFGLALPLAFGECASLAGLVDFRALLGDARTYSAAAAHVADSRLRRSGAPNQHVSGRISQDLAPVLGVDAPEVEFDVRTDRFGLRNSRDRADPDVVCLGDSVLVAALVPAADTLTERLERALRASVLNVAEPAYAPAEEAIRLESLRLPERPRLVVQFLFEGNDLADTASFRAWSARSVRTGWPESGLGKSLLAALHAPRRGVAERRVGVFAGALGDELVWFLYDAERIERDMGEMAALKATLADLRRRTLGSGGRYAIVFVPMKLRVLHSLVRFPENSALRDPRMAASRFAPDLSAWAASEGIPTFDLTPALRAVAEAGTLPYFPADTHLSAAGHAAAAAALEPWLRALLAELRS